MTYLGKSIKGGLATDQGNTDYSSTAKTWAPAGTGRTGCRVELPDPLTRLFSCRTDIGCSSALNLDKAVGGSASTWLHAGSLKSQNWGCGFGKWRTWWFWSQLLRYGCRSKMFILWGLEGLFVLTSKWWVSPLISWSLSMQDLWDWPYPSL